MELELMRIARKSEYTIGRLYINGVYFCDTLEDYDRLYFGKKKVAGKTAIPAGRYNVTLNNYSPRFGNKEPYKSLANGCVPLICKVRGFSGVRIHIGNDANDTEGCLLVGLNTKVGMLTKSRETYELLWTKYLAPVQKRHEPCSITIK